MDAVRAVSRGAVAGVLLSLAAVLLLAAPPPVRAAAAVRVSAAPAVFSPNGDGAVDRAVVSVRLARAGTLSVGVYDAAGKLVVTLQRPKKLAPGRRVYAWDGRAKAGPCGDGRYTIAAKLRAGRKTSTARCSVTLDTAPPVVRLTSALEPTVFAGGGLTVDLPYAVSEAGGTRLALEVYRPKAGSDEPGEALGSLDAGVAKAEGAVTWDGRAAPGAWLPSSRYCLVLAATDTAGNRGVSPPLGAAVFAPTEVKGRVVTAAGAPVEGAVVDAVGTTVTATTAADGSFTLGDCPMGLRVLRAQKEGMEAGGAGARVNMSPATWTITMGQRTVGAARPVPPAGAAARSAPRPAVPATRGAPRSAGRAGWWDDVTDWFEPDTYRMSGRFEYLAEDGTTHLPIAQARVVVRDYWVDAFGVQVYDELATSSTDAQGDYEITYEDGWDEAGTPDVRVCVLAADGDGEVADVSGPYLGGTWYFSGAYWADNSADRDEGELVDATEDRVVFRLLDAVRQTHDAGYVRPLVDITYPGHQPILGSDGDGAFSSDYDLIHVREGTGWGPTIFHEYGHAWMYSAYDLGGGTNSWDSYQSAADTDYDDFYSVEDPWTAFREAWAQFVELRMLQCDHTGAGGSFECDFDIPGTDDSRVINSIARVLWDLYDDAQTPMVYTFGTVPYPVGPRLTAEYGLGDDDSASAGPFSNVEVTLKHVVDEHHPETVSELRGYLRDHMPGDTLLLRGVDGAFYRQGVTGGIVETPPVVAPGSVFVEGGEQGSAFTGTVTLWCRATDADADRLKVSFEVASGSGPGAPGLFTPLTFSLQSSSAPEGHSGSGWYKAEWDTTAPSPVEILVAPQVSDARYTTNDRERCRVAAGTRRDYLWVRAIALDGLAESAPVESEVFAVDNGTAPPQGVSGRVTNALTHVPISGARVELRDGQANPFGTVLRTATTAADGSYVLEDVEPGGYTVAASRSGFSANSRLVTVVEGTPATGQDIELMPEGLATDSMRSATDGYIRWEAKTDFTNATYELWYRPQMFATFESGLVIAQISRDYPDWKGLGLKRRPIMEIWCGSGVVTFQVNENTQDEDGYWHRVASTTSLQLGRWYHIAAQVGSLGMKLFIDGHLEGSAPSYKKGAEADDGAAPGTGWFSLGDNRTEGSGYMTAYGDYRGLRVSKVQRYAADFTPPLTPSSDADAVVTDPLAGTTNGDCRNFVPTPAGP